MLDPDTIRAMAKWPDVPAVTGWLTLDGTGRWYIRGQRIKHPLILAHIQSNYEGDAAGRWYFQNGPQRVYVQLETAPFVLSWTGEPKIGFRDQCGRHHLRFERAVLDEEGRLYLVGDHGFAYVLDQDLETVLGWLCLKNGGALPEDDLFIALDSVFEQLTNAPVLTTELALRIGPSSVPVEGCRSDHLETRFAFQKEPIL